MCRRAAEQLTRLVLRPNRPGRPPSRKVAVVVPLAAREGLLPDEDVSMRHLRHFLGRYDKYLVAPRGRTVAIDGFSTVYFDAKFFGSAAAHNQLLYWPRFYATFADYEFVLIYHLDSLVLSDALLQWCEAGFDYIGAPWVPCEDTPWVREAQVGNGGFTLMKVGAALEVLDKRYRAEPLTFWADALTRNRGRLQPLQRVVQWLWKRGIRLAPMAWALRHWRMADDPGGHGSNNDYLWSFHAARYLPTFRVAPVEEGLRFAFEAAPRRCFEWTGGRLPFGCHAWTKFDRDFWVPYLLPDSASRTSAPALQDV